MTQPSRNFFGNSLVLSSLLRILDHKSDEPMSHEHVESHGMQASQRLCQAFVVAGQSAEAGHAERAIAAFDHPMARQEDKSIHSLSGESGREGVTMLERRLRRVLRVAMFVWLFLPFNRPPDVVPNGMGIVIVFLQVTWRLTDRPSAADLIYSLRVLLEWSGIPLLLALNLALSSSWSRIARALYILVLLYLLPACWYGAFHIDERFKSVGFWTGLILISSAALLEITFFVRGRQNKTQPGN